LVHKFGTPVVINEKLTHLFPSPAKLANADLTVIGLPKARARTINLLAQAVEDGKLCFSGVINSEEFAARLCEIPGIGPWTAQYVAMRALGEPDAFPAGDLGLLRAVNLVRAKDLEARAEAWRPWRAYAAMYLWQGAHHERRVLHTNGKPARAVAAGGR
jgi:AraC family transcriptional regulator of adaptative response / DNA-3-methyladenine glycosylase II